MFSDLFIYLHRFGWCAFESLLLKIIQFRILILRKRKSSDFKVRSETLKQMKILIKGKINKFEILKISKAC
jgi:hypothetical protein